VTYSAEQKTAALGVAPAVIEAAGLVSEAVARAMAEGALARSPADMAVSVTGVAGPEPDEDGTPVGIVHFAVARRGHATLHAERRYGDIGRGPCRYGAVEDALGLLERAAGL
jgi:nicotinamide-nucleotide amidase